MIPHIRRAAALCLLLLLALFVNAARIQVVQTAEYDDNPANRRPAIARYGAPRGDIFVAGPSDGPVSVTGSKDSREHLRYERTYTDGPLYAPVTGYSSQTYGTSLIENAEDGVLAGTDSRLTLLPFVNEITRGRQPGGEVHTTIKSAVQRAAFEGLGDRQGAVAAIEPATGRILALASTPSYDPELLSGNSPSVARAWTELNADESRPMLNRAIRQTYPPGSTFKVVTAAAALDSGVLKGIDVETDSPIPYILPGTTTELGNEARGCRDATLRYAFTVSCNSVFAQLGVEVGLAGMAETAEKFGFNDAELRIPSRVVRSNFGTEMDASQVALSSIGQFDTAATPLQMAMVTAAVANGGNLRHPYLVDAVSTADGDPVGGSRAGSLHQAMSPSTATQLQRMMVDVVTEGTGKDAAIPGVEVGGKTGTAQHGIDNSGIPYAWFISWARADDAFEPSVAVAVVVEDAKGDRADISGGGIAAPIAREVMQAALDPPLRD